MSYNKLKTLILYGLLISFVIGCTNAEDKTETTPKRIILKEATNVNATKSSILRGCT